MLKSIKKIMKKFTRVKPIVIRVEKDKVLDNRVAVVTGGGSGIGFAIAKYFAKSGAKVIICGRNIDKLNHSISLLSDVEKERIKPFVLDITKVATLDDALNDMQKLFDEKISILVNNAGINEFVNFPNITEQEFDNCVNTNIKGTLFLSQEISKYMIRNNIQGNILNIGSSSCFRPAISPYHISKWAIRGMTMGMARVLIKNNIIVNGIAPGPTATAMLNSSNDDIYYETNPSKRMAVVDEIASLAVKMVSDSSRYIVGEMICVTGGAGNLTYDDIKY